MMMEDVSQSEVAWWQWGIAVVSLLATAVSVNITTFNVTTLTEAQTQSMAPEQMMDIAGLPGSLSGRCAADDVGDAYPSDGGGDDVADDAAVAAAVQKVDRSPAHEKLLPLRSVARRVAAGSYGVELSPPYFVPVWPFPSVGAFGAVSRRLSTVPNEEASIGMSLASSLAGLAASLLIILVGFSMGSDGVVNLNYQLLPAALKVILRPFLGTASLTQAPDPFLDPVAVTPAKIEFRAYRRHRRPHHRGPEFIAARPAGWWSHGQERVRRRATCSGSSRSASSCSAAPRRQRPASCAPPSASTPSYSRTGPRIPRATG
ncbi:unnamed protein product [Prorocentrum cordatum]|uniref:H(+)-exporting diphosphatase n=1 Tax=Prorocentrum cordatum TaxID=2364126 RepID=A0ABN9USX8_9DINO|nr:unnamed protein product [Polarella glacialis]